LNIDLGFITKFLKGTDQDKKHIIDFFEF